ncbi:hypothetical protein LOAG_00241 [Loa loa]|uniref:Uncharacterized protein n=1 Tax=Loa loa TaxID=7209 RepID=A0A1S0UBK7_LOALO|nr:hypothetical protein LOAG_00241 [Loa loa]EFO28246.1 hypothetical protein LOAG_00241 [Loa loa]
MRVSYGESKIRSVKQNFLRFGNTNCNANPCAQNKIPNPCKQKQEEIYGQNHKMMFRPEKVKKFINLGCFLKFKKNILDVFMDDPEVCIYESGKYRLEQTGIVDGLT